MTLTFDNGEYGIILHGAPLYTVRYLEGIRQADTVTALMELLETGNTVRTSAGCYQVKYGIDGVWGIIVFRGISGSGRGILPPPHWLSPRY